MPRQAHPFRRPCTLIVSKQIFTCERSIDQHDPSVGQRKKVPDKNGPHVDQFTFHISLPSLKFTIVIHLSLLTTTSTGLILAECMVPVMYELS